MILILRRSGIARAALLTLLATSHAIAGGYTPEEARARMTLPPGFSAGVFASEPDIRQPVAACFDGRGRMWVIEYLQYPTPAGLKPVTVDPFLRTEYDRVPEPPPKGPRGADRIKILEDTDGDGKADKVTTFLEGLNLASGLVVGRGGVFVAQAPYLLFYPDKDRDDRPDGDPEVLLTGFGLQDAHATVNSLAWGPDGWLYGAQGSTVTANIRGIGFQQGIWRYHPITKAFELFAEGGGNTWGLDFDATGQAFGSSNGGYVAFHMVQGGYYVKGFAKHGPLHNPNTFGYFGALDYKNQKVGGHVTPGGIIYKGDAFPAEFRGTFIGANLLSNAVYWHTLAPEGSTFSAKHAGTLLDAHDPWFRPIDLLTGPEGALYVVDWYDRRASHLDPRDTWDRSNGRIYRITYEGTTPVKPFDLDREPSARLVERQAEPDDWFAAEARRVLGDRRDPSVIEGLKRSVVEERDETKALRALWSLAVSGGFDETIGLALLDHPVASVRCWAIRLLGDDAMMNAAIRDRLVTLAQAEPDATVRSQLASSCRRWKFADVSAALAKLAARQEDATDPHIPLLLWWAIEAHLRNDRAAVIALVRNLEWQGVPIATRFLVERTVRVLAARGEEEDFRSIALLLNDDREMSAVDRVIAGLEKGTQGKKYSEVPASLKGPLRDQLSGRVDPFVTRVRLLSRFGDAGAIAEAIARASAPRTAEGDRLAMIELLDELDRPKCYDALLKLAREDKSPAVRLAALGALAGDRRLEVAEALLAEYAGWDAALRERALDLLCARKDSAAALLDAIEKGRVAAKDLKLRQALQIARHDDPALTARLETAWGKVPAPNAAAKARRIAEVRGILPEGDKGDASRGHAVFKQVCAGCHRLFGEGEAIGPDLSGAERGDLDFLLNSLVDPSAVVRKEYQATAVAMGDGRVLTGLVVEEAPNTITIVDEGKRRVVLARDSIEAMRPSSSSIMPEGLLDTLPEDQVRDLFKYLQGPPPR